MIRDITLGQYYPAQSVVHALDPRVKLLGTMLFLISLFINSTFTGYLLVIAFFYMVVRTSKVPLSFILKGLKGILFILLLTTCISIFITPGEEVFRIWKLKATKEGLIRAAFFSIRVMLLVMGSSVMTFTTTPTSLTDGLERSMRFLRVFHFPVHDFAVMLGIALRFIPIISEEADKIIKAQEARGADFSAKNPLTKVKNMVPLLVPLLVSAFRRAEELAMALDARCYNDNPKRTKLHPLRYQRRDRVAYAVLFLYLAVVIALRLVAPLWHLR